MTTGGLIAGIGDFGVVDLINQATQDATAEAQAFADEANAAAQTVGNVVNRELQILPVKAGQAMNIGTPVYVSGADGTNIVVSPASNASEATSSKVLGLLMQTLANNGQGSVVTQGKHVGLNTSTATLGNPVWLGVNGALIYGLTNKPVAPAHLVYLGVVSRVHATLGEIIVHVQNGVEFDEIHDFKVENPTKGQVPTYNGNGLWENKLPNLQEQNNPDISFAIVDAQNKILAYFDLLGKLFADVNLSANNVTTLSIMDNAVTKQKLETSLQSLLTLLSGTQAVSDMQGDGYFITDSTNKKLLEIGLDGKIKGLFDFSLSPIQLSDLSSNITSLMYQTYTFNQDFVEYVYRITDSEGKIIFGIRQDGTTSTITQLPNLSNEIQDRLNKPQMLVKFGDSLTQGAGGGGTSDTTVLRSLMQNYSVINCGVGGENVATISARIGGVPAIITEGFVLPATYNQTVEISSTSNVRLKNVYGTAINPLLQGGGSSVNPCYIEGIACTLSWNGSQYFLSRNISSATSTNIKANSLLNFFGNSKYRDVAIIVIEMGQNGGYSTVNEYIKYIKACVEYNRKSNFIVVGQHTGTPASRLELETRCLQEFGNKYINMREYISGNALYDLGLTPTSDDLTAMTNGTFPPSLWAGIGDSVHGNANFYTAKGRKIYSRILELGY